MIPAWRSDLGEGTGALNVDIARGLVVARLQGGASVALDLETGARCSTLVKPPRGEKTSSIDPYSERSFVVDGSLIGPSGLSVSAVDLATAATLWSRPVAASPERTYDDYSLRDGLSAVAAGGSAILGFYFRHGELGNFQWEELVLGLDPDTGDERWRRSAIMHARNDPLRVGGDMRLVSDGQRAIVDGADRLIVIDGASGAITWTKPLPRNPDPRALRPPRVFVGAGRALVATPGEKLAIYGAADGKLLAEAPSPGRSVIDAVVRRDTIVLSVEDAPGTAFIAALDAGGRVLWKREAASSVARMRGLPGDLPSTIYALQGDGRLIGIDEQTGAERGGITVGFPYEFWIGDARGGGARMILPLKGLAAFDLSPDARPKPLDPFLRWSFDEKPGPDGHLQCYPRAAAWIDGEGKSQWERQLPARMRAIVWGLCDELEMTAYRRMPRFAGWSPYVLIGLYTLDDAIAVADASGVFVMRRSDGAVLLDRSAPGGNGGLFDDGTFTLSGGQTCSGEAQHGRIFARCGASLVYFNGTNALSIDARSWRVEAESKPGSVRVLSRGVTTKAEIGLGTRTLSLLGRTYMH